MFRTQYDRAKIEAQPGSRLHVLYQLEADDHGVVDLVPVGKENIYDKIQSFAESCDLHMILKRFENGEIDVLNQRLGSFADVTQMPKSYADVLNISIKGKEYFDNLPKEIKKEFGYNFAAFLASLDNPKDFIKKAGVDLSKALGFITEDASAVPAAAAAGGDALTGSGAAGEVSSQPEAGAVKTAGKEAAQNV